jgi:hypothetical protein
METTPRIKMKPRFIVAWNPALFLPRLSFARFQKSNFQGKPECWTARCHQIDPPNESLSLETCGRAHTPFFSYVTVRAYPQRDVQETIFLHAQNLELSI